MVFKKKFVYNIFNLAIDDLLRMTEMVLLFENLNF